MAGKRGGRKLSDLEYNVFNSTMRENEDMEAMRNNKGCMTVFVGIMITLVVCFVIMAAVQMGHNAPAITCAEPGCSNRPRSGSNYCWLHGSSQTSTRRKGGSSAGSGSGSSSSGGGSIVNRGSSSDNDKQPSKSKIFSGIENKDSTGSSSSGSITD